MGICFFVSDLHGREDRYRKLFHAIEKEKPAAVFLGGDLFPSGLSAIADVKTAYDDFFESVMAKGFARLKMVLGTSYPSVFLILGNDDGKFEEHRVEEGQNLALWFYMHGQCIPWETYFIYGYAYVPPTPFMLKDWERYDVST